MRDDSREPYKCASACSDSPSGSIGAFVHLCVSGPWLVGTSLLVVVVNFSRLRTFEFDLPTLQVFRSQGPNLPLRFVPPLLAKLRCACYSTARPTGPGWSTFEIAPTPWRVPCPRRALTSFVPAFRPLSCSPLTSFLAPSRAK